MGANIKMTIKQMCESDVRLLITLGAYPQPFGVGWECHVSIQKSKRKIVRTTITAETYSNLLQQVEVWLKKEKVIKWKSQQ